LAYSCLLKNELLGASIEDVKGQCDERRALVPLEGMNLFQVEKKEMHACTYACVCVHACTCMSGCVQTTVAIVTVTVMFKLITWLSPLHF